MGNRCKRQDLQQAGKAATDSEPVQPEIGGIRRRCEEELRGLLPQWFLAAASRREAENKDTSVEGFFLSLFGGVGNPAKFWSERCGLAAVIDYEFDSCNDLSKHFAWNRILKVLEVVDILGIDLPCNTWSRARRAPPWSRLPKPLRSYEFIFGLPDLKKSDVAKVQQANNMFFGALRCIRRCLRTGKAGYLENPANSWVWQTPQMKRICMHPRVKLVRTDLCQYDVQWKKPTYILFWNVTEPLLKRCAGKHRCSRTNKAHVQLTGLVGKRFVTQQAQVYTKAFAAALMLNFHHEKAHPGPPVP